jgi:hypothetical protein
VEPAPGLVHARCRSAHTARPSSVASTSRLRRSDGGVVRRTRPRRSSWSTSPWRCWGRSAD